MRSARKKLFRLFPNELIGKNFCTLYMFYMDDKEEDFIHAEQIEHVKHSDDLNVPHGPIGCFATGSVVDERHLTRIAKPVRARS